MQIIIVIAIRERTDYVDVDICNLVNIVRASKKCYYITLVK